MRLSTKRTITLATFAIAALAFTGCASSAPGELTSARNALDIAENMNAESYSPNEYGEARLALQRAEASFQDDGDSDTTRDLAYVAMREAQQAKVATARHQLQVQEGQLYGELSETFNAYATVINENVLVFEDAEVLLVHGNLFYEFDSATLTPLAKDKLDRLHDALKLEPEKVITVVGHADALGSDGYNETLSKERARSVKDYLAREGIEPERVRVKARGENDPIASNDDPEGRANNRRVEIIFSEKPYALNY